MAIQFPNEDLFEGKEYRPPGSSITYVYSLTQGWLLLPAEVPVSKDYVDTQDFLKYDKTGGKISGDVTIGPYQGSDNIDIKQTGELIFNGTGDLKLTFNPTNRRPATLTVNDNKMLEMDHQGLSFDLLKTINYKDPSRVFFSYNSPGKSADVIILECPQTNQNVTNVIKLCNNFSSSLQIRDQSGSPVFNISASGETTFLTNESFMVKRKEGRDPLALSVNPYNYKLTASVIYNEGLVNGGTEIETPNGSQSYIEYKEDELVATMGAIRRYQFQPGDRVFADGESAAEIGGLWMDSTGFYIRYK